MSTLKVSCGCVMTSDGKMFLIKPCSLKCPTYLYTVKESKRLGNELMFIKVEGLKK